MDSNGRHDDFQFHDTSFGDAVSLANIWTLTARTAIGLYSNTFLTATHFVVVHGKHASICGCQVESTGTGFSLEDRMHPAKSGFLMWTWRSSWSAHHKRP